MLQHPLMYVFGNEALLAKKWMLLLHAPKSGTVRYKTCKESGDVCRRRAKKWSALVGGTREESGGVCRSPLSRFEVFPVGASTSSP